jgi:hypothetical protein
MRFEQLTPEEQDAVIDSVKQCFPEFKLPGNEDALFEYLNDKDDFQRVNIAEDDEDPIWIIEW